MCDGSKTKSRHASNSATALILTHGIQHLWVSLAPSPRLETWAGFCLTKFPGIHKVYFGTVGSLVCLGFFSWERVSWIGIARYPLNPAHHTDVQVVGSAFDQRSLGTQVVCEDHESGALHCFWEKLDANKNGKGFKFHDWCLLIWPHNSQKQALVDDLTEAT